MTDNLMVYMVTQEKRGSPEAEVTYFASITYHLQKKKTINRSLSQPFCLITQWEGMVRDKTKRLHGGPTPYEFSCEFGQLLCRHEMCLPTKKLKQRYVTKKQTNKQTNNNNCCP